MSMLTRNRRPELSDDPDRLYLCTDPTDGSTVRHRLGDALKEGLVPREPVTMALDDLELAELDLVRTAGGIEQHRNRVTGRTWYRRVGDERFLVPLAHPDKSTRSGKRERWPLHWNDQFFNDGKKQPPGEQFVITDLRRIGKILSRGGIV
jgi:hypothetical protein